MMPEFEGNYFTCLCLNIRSLGNSKNFNNFVLLLKSLPTSPIFLGITETWLRNGQQGPHLCLPYYNFNSKNRSKNKGGGIGAYVLQTKTQWIRNALSKFEEGIFESIFIELKLGNLNIICGALYRPPNKSNNIIDAFISILEETLNIVKKENKLLYLMGDFNFDLLDSDRHTDIFTDLMFELGNIPPISKPTRISPVMSLLHNIWTNNLKYPINSAIITDLVSDHFAVLQCTKLPFSFTTFRTKQTRDFNSISLGNFRDQLNAFDWSDVCTETNPDLSLFKFQNVFNSIFHETIPLKNVAKSNPWFDNELQLLQKLKRKAYYKHLGKTNADSKSKYSTIKNHYERVIKTKKANYYKKLLQSYRNDIKMVRKTINEIIGRSKMTSSPKCIEIDDAKLTNTQDIANAINLHFSAIAKNLLAQNHPSQSLSTTSFTNFNNHSSFFINPITAQEIKCIIYTTKPKSSSGCNGIPSKLLRELPESILKVLAHIFTQSFNAGKFPSRFKLAKVVPVLKKGNSTDLNNYRPISLPNTFSKILEKSMHKKMLCFLNHNHALSEFQFGFRPNYSTSLACTCLINKLTKYFLANKLALMAFLDLSKAFATLDQRILLNKYR